MRTQRSHSAATRHSERKLEQFRVEE
jgi:hypothetical protein